MSSAASRILRRRRWGADRRGADILEPAATWVVIVIIGLLSAAWCAL